MFERRSAKVLNFPRMRGRGWAQFRALAMAGAGFALPLATPAAAQVRAEFAISLLYSEISPRNLPNTPATQRYTVRLSGANQVSEERNVKAGRFSHDQQQLRVLGQTGNDGGAKGAWRVAGPNRLQRTRDLPQSIEIITLQVQGQSCTVSLETRLKPGFQDYKYIALSTKKYHTYSKPVVTGTTCTIK